MTEIFWTKVYNGRLLHGFTEERREKNLPGIGKRFERKTLCGKWFMYLYDGWNANWYTHGVPRCKKCEVENEDRTCNKTKIG